MSALVELDRAQLEELLAELHERLVARGVTAGVYVVGGAAIALTVAARRVTVDVDAIATDQVVYDEATAIARRHGLPPRWLNAGAAPWVPPREVTPPRRIGLTVDYAPPEHLLAMKMVAMRERDYADIALLATALGLEDAEPELFARVLREAYGDEATLEMALGVPRSGDLATEVEAVARSTVRIVRHLRTPPG